MFGGQLGVGCRCVAVWRKLDELDSSVVLLRLLGVCVGVWVVVYNEMGKKESSGIVSAWKSNWKEGWSYDWGVCSCTG